MAKYSKGASKEVGEALHEMKRGKLKTGTGKKVTSPKQAIAIGLSEAREKGEKVPSKSSSKKGGGKTGSKSSKSNKSKK
jgi:hypothetical protein